MGYCKRFIALCFVFCFFTISKAQQFGGNPSSVKWQQINTDTTRIIFPKGLDSIAKRIAAVTHELQKNYSNTIGSNLQKINVVLQKDATVSNAFVALGPYHSEYYLTPPQNAFELGAQNWPDNLAIHEFRHVQQYSNFNIGLSKLMSVLFGENGRALANSASIPDWFFEGDAVYNETLLSEQGRGRLPLFFNRYKSLFNDDRHYSYMQLRNGSLRHYIPGHYELGYLLVAYGREKYGDDFWRKVTQDAAAFKPLFYPLQGAVKRYAGISYNQLVKDAFAFYQTQWNKEDAKKNLEWITGTQKNNVVNYKYPYAAEDGSLIVLKNTRRDIPAVYKLNTNGTETRIAVRDIAYDDYFSYNAGKIVYAAYQADIRWGNRDFSVIKILDINSNKEKKISTHTRYFSPDVSHNGITIAAVEIKDNLQSSIIVMNENGATIKKFTNNDRFIYSYPKFSPDDRFLYTMIRNDKGEMGIEKIDISDGTVSTILSLKKRVLGFPVVKEDTLLYSCSNNGRDEIWAYINSQNSNYRVATYITGLYQACLAADGDLVASAFTSYGYRLARVHPEWQAVDLKNDTLTNLYVTKPFNEKSNLLLESVHANHYSVTKYHKLFHPFNFHSWAPYLDYPDYSFNIYGQNILNTLQSQIYYTYNDNEKYHRVGYTAIYGGWYLQPFFDVNQTWNRNGVTDSGKVKWNEFNASAGLSLPLNLSGGKQYRNLTLAASYNINNVQWTTNSKKLLNDINYVNARLSYSAQIQKATDQIYPRWAQRLLFQYRGSVTSITAHQFLTSASFYLPGFVKTHNIILNAAYQARDTAGKYFFTNNFPFSRGYDAIDLPRVWKIGGNYHFPFLYPDWGFADIVYFLRIRANIFYDYTEAKSLRTGNRYKFRSYGGEIYFDTKWWNQQPLIFGIRYSRLLDNEIVGLQPNQWEIILPVTILN